VDIKFSEILASFIFKIEELFSETKCPPIILHHVFEALNTNIHSHENCRILHQAITLSTAWYISMQYSAVVFLYLVVLVTLSLKIKL